MNTENPEYPQAARSSDNAPFLDAWLRGELVLQQCGDCGHKIYFPRVLCPNCWSQKISWIPLSGRGKIVSYTRIHKHIHGSFQAEAPTLLAEILLDEGWSMLARIVTPDSQAVASGQRVELVSLPEAARYPLPTFRSGP